MTLAQRHIKIVFMSLALCVAHGLLGQTSQVGTRIEQGYLFDQSGLFYIKGVCYHPTQIAGIVAHADLRLAELDDVLDAHEEAAKGLFRGIRHAGASAGDIEGLAIPGGSDRNLMSDEAFRAGVARLGERGLTYDTWLYHFQINDFVELARAVPSTTMILDHFGTPLGVGEFANQKDAIFEQWKEDIERASECPNVFAKLGGLAMPDNGFGWHERAAPP